MSSRTSLCAMTIEKLTGLIAAPHTPFDANGRLDPETIHAQAEALVRQDVSGAFVCGTTGEGLSLTTVERRTVVDEWVKAGAGRLKIIAHVGHQSVEEARQLARHAESAGVDAVSAVAPSFFRPRTAGEFADYCAPIASAAGGLPFYIYHSPGMSGVALSPVEVLEAAADAVPTLAGIKFNHGDLFQYQQCLAFDGGRFDIPFGVDEAYLAGLAVGATSAVGSTYNYAATVYHRMKRQFEAGEFVEARESSRRVVQLVELLIEFGVLAAGKALMELHGVDCGDPRVPNTALSRADKDRLLDAARTISGLLDVQSKSLAATR